MTAPDTAKTVWRTMTSTLLGVVVTGAGAWLVFGANKVTRDEMRAHVAQQLQPLKRIEESVILMAQSNQDLLIELRVLGTEFKSYVMNHPK
jgi:hypothetical protein